MKLYIKITLLFLITMLLFSCQDDTGNSGQAKIDIPEYQFISILKNRSMPDCNSDNNDCTHIKISNFTVSDSDEDNDITLKINNILEKEAEALVSESISEGDKLSFDQSIDILFNDWKEYQKDGGSEFAWYVNLYTDLSQVDKFLNVKMRAESFTGGAHPNTYTKIFLIDLRDGSKMELKDYIVSYESYKALAEETFREHFDLEPDTDLGEEGFFFEKGVYSLPAEMGLSETGIILFYNSYEILPYSDGPTEITIPYEKLHGVLDFEM